MVGFVSVDTDSLDAFVERGIRLQRQVDSLAESLAGQRSALLNSRLPVVAEYSSLPAVERLAESVAQLNGFTAEISDAMNYPDAGFRLRLIELFGVAGDDGRRDQAGRPSDDELLHLETLETVFGLLGPDFDGDVFERLNAMTDTSDDKEELARLIAAERRRLGLDRNQVGELVEDMVAAARFYAANSEALRRLDAAADRTPGRVDNVFSIRDVDARLADRRSEVADEVSERVLGLERTGQLDACVDSSATTTLLVRKRVMAMTEPEVIAFRLAYAAATGREPYGDLLPRPIGGPTGETWRTEEVGSNGRIAEPQQGDLAYNLAAKLAPELITTDDVIVDRIDTRVTGSTLSLQIYQGAQIFDPTKPDRFTALVYIDGEPVRNYAGNPKRFRVDGTRFDYELTEVGEVEIVIEQRTVHGDYRFHTYSTATTDDRVAYASDQLEQLREEWVPVDGNIYSEFIPAVLISDESSAAIPLRLVLEPIGHGGHGWKIIDNTDLENPRTYTTSENSIEAAFDEFIKDSNLPPGQIAAYHPETGEELNAYADGAGSWQKISDGAGTGAVVLFVIGGVAYLSTPLTGPAGPAVGSVAWAGSGALEAVSTAARIADEVEHGQFDLTSRQAFFDAVDIIGGATGVGGTVLRTGKFVAITTGIGTAAENAKTVVVLVEYHERIQEIHQNDDLSPTEKRIALDAIHREAVRTAGLIVLDRTVARHVDASSVSSAQTSGQTPTTNHAQMAEGTLPSRRPDPDATTQGVPERVPPMADDATTQALRQQVKIATDLAMLGYEVEHQPSPTPGELSGGLSATKNPDFRIEGQIFDAYAPTSQRVRNIATEIQSKVDGAQTERVVVDLSQTEVGAEELLDQLKSWPIDGLKEVIIMEDSHVVGRWTQ